MKKFLYFLFFFICFFNVSFAKILNIENKLQLEVPNSHKFMRYEDSEIGKNFEEFIDLIEGIKIDVYLVGPSKYVDLEKAILDGEDPMENKYVKSILKKLERKNFQNETKAAKWMILEAKKIMRKEKIDFMTYAFIFNKSLKDILVGGNELDDIILELQSMNNSELAKQTQDLKKMISSLDGANNKSYLIGPVIFDYNKFKIAKNEYGNLFLKGPSKLTYAVNELITVEVSLNVFFGTHNNKTYLFISACYVDCSKFNSKFDKMIKPVFSTNTQVQETISSTSGNSNLVEQLKILNDLYKSGVLTKEEFEKAKKKILN